MRSLKLGSRLSGAVYGATGWARKPSTVRGTATVPRVHTRHSEYTLGPMDPRYSRRARDLTQQCSANPARDREQRTWMRSLKLGSRLSGAVYGATGAVHVENEIERPPHLWQTARLPLSRNQIGAEYTPCPTRGAWQEKEQPCL